MSVKAGHKYIDENRSIQEWKDKKGVVAAKHNWRRQSGLARLEKYREQQKEWKEFVDAKHRNMVMCEWAKAGSPFDDKKLAEFAAKWNMTHGVMVEMIQAEHNKLSLDYTEEYRGYVEQVIKENHVGFDFIFHELQAEYNKLCTLEASNEQFIYTSKFDGSHVSGTNSAAIRKEKENLLVLMKATLKDKATTVRTLVGQPAINLVDNKTIHLHASSEEIRKEIDLIESEMQLPSRAKAS